MRGLITIAIAQVLDGDYILSVAAALGAHQGLSREELEAARHGESNDPKIRAALDLAIQAVKTHGKVEPSLVAALREAGYSDEEMVEITGLVGLNLFRNYFNLLAGTEVDFPRLRASEPIGRDVSKLTVSA